MKVCLVIDDLPPDCGGSPLITLGLAQRLNTVKSVNATVIAWARSGIKSSSDPLPVYVHSVEWRLPNTGSTRTPMGLIGMMLSLVALVTRLGRQFFSLRRDFDLLHVSNAASLFSLMTVPFAKILKKPVIIEMVLLGADDPLKLGERRRQPEQQLFPHVPLKYALFQMADAYVSISPALSDAYLEAGLDNAKLFQIPYGVDVEKFKPATLHEKRNLRHKLGLDDEQTIILFVGVINERKGVRRLAAAFREVALSHSDAQLLVVGPSLLADADYLQSLRTSIDTWGLSEKVILVDEMVENVDEYMRASDVFCFPTSREGFGMVIIEAMAAGLPVVASRLDGVTTEIIRSDQEGILVPAEDTTKLAEAMTDLVANPIRRVRLGQAARKRILDKYTNKAIDRQYLRLYKHVLNSG